MIKLEDKLYTSTEVASILGVSLRSVYRYIEEGKLTAEVKTATGRHRFTKQDILDKITKEYYNKMSICDFFRALWFTMSSCYICLSEFLKYKIRWKSRTNAVIDVSKRLAAKNMMYVKETTNSDFLEFGMLTLVPYEKNLIDKDLLSRDELNYLTSYYKLIENKIMPHLSDQGKRWLHTQLH